MIKKSFYAWSASYFSLEIHSLIKQNSLENIRNDHKLQEIKDKISLTPDYGMRMLTTVDSIK